MRICVQARLTVSQVDLRLALRTRGETRPWVDQVTQADAREASGVRGRAGPGRANVRGGVDGGA